MQLNDINAKLEGKSIVDKLKTLTEIFPEKVVFTSSFGVEDQVITDLIFKNNIPVKIVTLDTGRLFEQTYKVYFNTVNKYNKPLKAYFPSTHKIEELLQKKGPFSFYDSIENRKECCTIRKVEPLNRSLEGNKIWVTGIRADQSGGRNDMVQLELDSGRNMYKFHPIFDWSLKEVEKYLIDNNVPYNNLHHEGFISIGCEPCTRAVKEGEDFRSGRWWWENNSGKECGLHSK